MLQSFEIMQTNHFPIFLKLQGRPCLVVGGGEVAARKSQQLLKSGACITIVAPVLNPVLAKLWQAKQLDYIQQPYRQSNLENMELVIAATDDHDLNQIIAQDARTKNCLINVVDSPAASTFMMPSVIDRHPVMIAVSTSGASPVLARLLRARLETLIPANYGKLASLIATFRDSVKQKFPNIIERRRFWEHVLQGPIAEMLYARQDQRAIKQLQAQLQEASPVIDTTGEVYLVGTGPGDPDLLTFRALRLMQQADVVLYDRLVGQEIVELVKRDAERIYVGKERSLHALAQSEINQLLVKLAQQGKRVLRLKGGDPFIFGRGGEEIDLLSANHIPFQIVPGITAATGCAAYSGIPLTHRDYAHSCLFVTAHVKDGKINLNWTALAQPQQTLAIYMGMHGVALLSEELIKHGLHASTPVAIIERGTTTAQRIYTTTLKQLPEIPSQYDIQAPSMIIIGQVVCLHEKLAWFQADKGVNSFDTFKDNR